ncbi:MULTISPECIES: antitoxin Xre-like helix-turn-helix domain-containing protein [unclassified Thioalkalivibrio]|uniref:type II RES/Xre toxin-antitoxin system antitoxin n=1 Tax=unclassified Thioalkalivibrio TaxID=2621013 RepID=UPI0003790A02|nr:MULTISPECIES: antitoxin Xre-like helix-turn-helix domain-containing protein [unclassified Thioalkalivibrio]
MTTTTENATPNRPDQARTFRFDTQQARKRVTVYGLVAKMIGIETKARPIQGKDGPYAHIIETVRLGLPARSLEQIGQSYGIPRVTLVHLAGVSETTYKRRLSKNERLDPEASDRAYRVARIAALAETIFEDHGKAKRWMNTYNRVLEEVPINLLDTEAGTELVETVLHRIDHGVFS